MNYNLNLFSSSNREALADKIAVAVSGDTLPDNKNPDITPVQVVEEPTKEVVEDNTKTEQDKKSEISKPKVKRKVVPPKKRPALSNLKNK